MSKSTKIIAGFGVAAALGVAALPLASFATSGDYGTVAVSAVVPDAISMTIDGNAPEEGVAAGNNVAFGNVAQGAFAESDGTTIKNNVTVISSNAAYNFKVQNTSTGANGALASATSTIAPFAEATKPAANQATSGWGFREALARVKNFFLVAFKAKPTYLGERIPISGGAEKTWDQL